MSTFAKTTALNGVAMALKLIASLLANKVVAVMLGPQGLALYGQFQSILTLVNGLASSAGQAGVIRLTAVHVDDKNALTQYWSAAFKAVLISSLLFVVIGVFEAEYIAEYILLKKDMANILQMFFLSVPFAAVTTLFLSCANGMSATKEYIIAGLIVGLLNSVAVVLGVFLCELNGIIQWIAIFQIVSLILVFYYFKSKTWFYYQYFLASSNRESLKKIFSLAVMIIVAVLSAPTIQIFIRHVMADMYGLVIVGYWQAISRIGDMYVMTLTALLGVYYFPRFSAEKNISLLRQDIRHFLTFVYPFFLLGYLVFYIFKEFFIYVIYSKEFIPALSLLKAQILLDATRVISWFFGYLVMARGSSKAFVVAELLVLIFAVIFSYVFLRYYGYIGAIYSMVLANIIYISILVFSLVKRGEI